MYECIQHILTFIFLFEVKLKILYFINRTL